MRQTEKNKDFPKKSQMAEQITFPSEIPDVKNRTKTHYCVKRDHIKEFTENLFNVKGNMITDRSLWFSEIVICGNKVIKSRYFEPSTEKLTDSQVSLILDEFDGVVISV